MNDVENWLPGQWALWFPKLSGRKVRPGLLPSTLALAAVLDMLLASGDPKKLPYI